MRETADPLREPQASAVGASRTAGPDVGRASLLALGVALFLSVSGAFGTGAAPFVVRFGFWVLATALGSATGVAAATLMSRRGWREGPRWRTILLLTAAIALPLTAVSWLLTSWVFGQPLRAEALAGFAVPTATVTAAITALNVMAPDPPAPPPPAPPGDAPAEAHAPAPPRPRLYDRLPPRLRGAELIALEAEDHYLRLHTTAGSDLVLMRLADAVAEAEGLAGAQTHRSWWVARDAVLEARRADGRAVLRLKGGLEAPVSRTYVPALKAAGWF
jgi:hypothetical protein